MVVVTILSIIAMMGSQLIKNIVRFSRLNTARVETQRGARDSLALINRNLRQAFSTTTVITQELNQPPYSSLAFKSVDGRWIRFYQQDKKLLYVNNTTTSTLSDNLRYIAFAYPRTDDFGIMSVSVTFEKDTYEGGAKALQMAIEKVRLMN